MTAPYYVDDTVTLWHGNCLAVLREMPDNSVNCCVTSPPYFGLRDYGVEGQHGAEESIADYVETMTAVFAEVRRVLAVDGTCWVNLGDSYARQGSNGRGGAGSTLSGRKHQQAYAARADRRKKAGVNLPDKNLIGIPWRVAFALQDDGWILRNAVVWNKPNAMPESMQDRLSSRYENMFFLTKSARYWFDLDAIREEPVTKRAEALSFDREVQGVPGQKPQHRPGRGGGTNLRPTGRQHLLTTDKWRNPGDVWTISTQPFHGAHFAVMASEVARRAVLGGCKPGGVVLDPYSGSGTTGLVATQVGRRYVGIELNRDYLDLSLRTRLAQADLGVIADEGAAS